MITQQDIETAQLQLDTKMMPLKILLLAAQNTFNAEVKELSMPLKNLLEQYNDEQCIDKNGVPVRVNDIINDGKNDYVVTKRGMQVFLGAFLFNSHIVCKKMNSDMSLNPKSKAKDVFPASLKNYTKISSLRILN